MGIHLDLPHLSRDALVRELDDTITASQFVLLVAPGNTGKSSLLTLFASQHPEFRYVPVDCVQAIKPVLAHHGIDVDARTCTIPTDTPCIVMMDDCERGYRDLEVWTTLLVDSATWLPSHVRFVLTATHVIEREVAMCPVQFASIPRKLTVDQLMITEAQAQEIISIEFPRALRFPAVLGILIRGCNGYVGLLRKSVEILRAHFGKTMSLSEQQLLGYVMSSEFVDQLSICFRCRQPPPTPDLRSFLIMCLWRDPGRNTWASMQFTHEDNQYLIDLIKNGVLIEDPNGDVEFTSWVAERVYTKFLYPSSGVGSEGGGLHS